MKKIINFYDREDFDNFINFQKIKTIGSGDEGIAYLVNNDLVIKKIINQHYDYDINAIITNDDFDLKSFAFPIELYAIDNKLVGYSSKYVPSVINEDDILTIDFDIFMKAYIQIKKDMQILNENKIIVKDLLENIVYNNKDLVAIDTCSYEKGNGIFYDSIAYLDLAIKYLLDNLFNMEEIYNEPTLEKTIIKAKKLQKELFYN